MSAATDNLVSLSAGDDLSIYNAVSLKENLFGQLDHSTGLELDLSQVQEIDSAGIQVLMFLKQEADRQGKGLQLVNHSKAVMEVFELLSLAAYFGDPLVIPADW